METAESGTAVTMETASMHAPPMLNCLALPWRQKMTVTLKLGTCVAVDTDEFPDETLSAPHSTVSTDSFNLFLNRRERSSGGKA